MRRLLDGFAGCFTTPTFEVFQAMVIGLIALRLLVDRRDELGRTRTQTVNRLHRLLLELVPGGAKRFLTAAQAQPRCTIVRNINRPR